MRKLVGTVGIELKATLKTRKLLILLNAKNARNSECAEVRYTAGTRGRTKSYSERLAAMESASFQPFSGPFHR